MARFARGGTEKQVVEPSLSKTVLMAQGSTNRGAQ